MYSITITNQNFIALRVEWAKSRARAMRWSEELRLLEEEMRRVLVFLEWDAGVWRHRARRVEEEWVGLSEAQSEGLTAFALRQAWIRDCLRSDFTFRWTDAATIFRVAITYQGSSVRIYS
jgi:hypothetical protein